MSGTTWASWASPPRCTQRQAPRRRGSSAATPRDCSGESLSPLMSCEVGIEVIFTRNSQSSPLRYFEGLHIKKACFVLYGLTLNWSLKSWPYFNSKDSFEPFFSWGFQKYPWWLDLMKNSLRCWGSKLMHPKQNRTFWSECPLTIKGERPAD